MLEFTQLSYRSNNMVVTDVEAKLALLGGKEMYPEKVSPMPWPPVSRQDATTNGNA